MIIYATFGGTINLNQLKAHFPKYRYQWTDIVADTGDEMCSSLISNRLELFKDLEIGQRYRIQCVVTGDQITRVFKVFKTNKNPTCKIIRKVNGEYLFIKGKFRGKKLSDIPENEKSGYLIWLGRNTNNEATIKNVLEMLKILNNEK